MTAAPRRPPPQLPFATSGWHRGDTSELHTGAHGSGTQRWAGRGTQHPTPPSHRPTPPAAGSTKRCFAVPLPPKRSKAVRFFAPPPRRTLCSPPRDEDPPRATWAAGVCSAGSLGSRARGRRRRCWAGGGPGRTGTTLQAGWHRSPVRRAGRRPSSHLPSKHRDPHASAHPAAPGGPPNRALWVSPCGAGRLPARVCVCVCVDLHRSALFLQLPCRRWSGTPLARGVQLQPPGTVPCATALREALPVPSLPPSAHTHTHTHTHPLAVIQAVPGVWISVTTYQQGREGEFKPVRPSSAPSRLPALLRAQRRWHRAQPRRNAPLLLPGVELHRGQCGAGKYVLERPVESLMNLLMCPELRAVGGESGRKEANRRLSRTAAGSRSPPHTLRAAPWGERGTAASRDPVPRGTTPRPHPHPLCAPGCRRGLHGAPRRTGARGPPRAGAPRHARTRGPTGAISPRRPPAPAHVAGDEALRPALCRRSARPTDPPAAPHPEPWGRAAPGSPQQHRAGMLAAPPRSLSPPLLSPRQRPHVSH